MATDHSEFNPFYTPYREFFDVWEKHTGEFWDEVLSNPLFLEWLGQNLRFWLGWQRMSQGMFEASLSALGLAGRAEQEQILHRLNRIEAQLNAAPATAARQGD